MNPNQHRRRARRQARGTQRVEEVLDAAEAVFAERGFDAATTAAMAARAGMSPGSLYQYFPNKEAIAGTLGMRYAEHLRGLHEAALTPLATPITLPELLGRIIDPVVAFNRMHPALMRLFGGSHISPSLQGVLDDLHAELFQRLDAAFAARLPRADAERRKRMVTVSLQIGLCLLPLTLGADSRESDGMASELKAALHGYWAPVFAGAAEAGAGREPWSHTAELIA